MVGAGDMNPVVVEDKSTVDSVSQFLVRDIPSADGYLRIDRNGSLFSMYFRQGSATPWELIRSYDRPDMPVIVITGYPSIESAVRSLRQRVDDYLTKPFNVTKLYKTVEETVLKAQHSGSSE